MVMANLAKQAISRILDNGIRDETNVDLIRKIRLINVFCLIGVLFVLPISIRSFELGHYIIFSIDILAIIFFIASFVYLGRTSKFVFSAHVFVHALFLILLFFAYSGGVEGTGVVWIFIFPVVALSLYDLELGMVYSVVFTICLTGFLFYPRLGAFDYPRELGFRIFCSYLIVTILAIVCEYYRRKSFNRMEELSRQLDIMSKHDDLTGLMNRRGIYDRLEHEQARMTRKKMSFSVILGDIDGFKKINDEFGHDAGDQVLRELPKVFSAHIRAQDIVARWGGEEFLFLLPETDFKGAYILGEKIRKAVQETIIIHSGRQIRITMSLGVEEISPGQSHESGIVSADRYLLKAKEEGRNRVLPLPQTL